MRGSHVGSEAPTDRRRLNAPGHDRCRACAAAAAASTTVLSTAQGLVEARWLPRCCEIAISAYRALTEVFVIKYLILLVQLGGLEPPTS
jgi:hypothetical protein